MKEYYLVCTRCNGYYQLDEGESPEEFEECQCGGELILVEDIYDYFDNGEYNDYEHEYKYEFDEYAPNYRNKKINKVTLFLVLLIIIVPTFLILKGTIFDINMSDDSMVQYHTLLGSDFRGYVIKDVYATSSIFNQNSKTIAIVTGIHPREDISKNVTTDLIRKYPLKSNMKIVHYDIKVTNNPDNYKLGRTNGEGIAADYILTDILKSDSDLVIICHDHRPGYGQGFYIATPEMDEKSVKTAELINQSISGFNYYRADNIKEHTTSALKFSKPLASAGYRTLVYEIPEWISYNEAYSMTENFISKCFNYI